MFLGQVQRSELTFALDRECEEMRAQAGPDAQDPLSPIAVRNVTEAGKTSGNFKPSEQPSVAVFQVFETEGVGGYRYRGESSDRWMS